MLLKSGGVEKELFGGARETTNNRMEMLAVIMALDARSFTRHFLIGNIYDPVSYNLFYTERFIPVQDSPQAAARPRNAGAEIRYPDRARGELQERSTVRRHDCQRGEPSRGWDVERCVVANWHVSTGIDGDGQVGDWNDITEVGSRNKPPQGIIERPQELAAAPAWHGSQVCTGKTGNFTRNASMIAQNTTASGTIVSCGGVFVSEMIDVQRVRVTMNKSRTFRVETAFSSIVAGSPDIADVKSLSDHLIYVQGKKTGTTNVILFDSSMKQIGILDVEVTFDIGNLQQNIQSGTGTRGIRVSASEGQVVLSGMAADAVAAERAMTIAQGSIPAGGIVVNAMSVAAPQQVMLEVRFLEVNRQAGRDLGVNLGVANANGTNIGISGQGGVVAAGRTPIGGINTNTGPLGAGGGAVGSAPTGSLPVLGTIGTLVGSAGGVSPAPFGSLLTSILRTSNGASVDLLITALETKGLARRLAEPNLTTLSGDAARFLAGGEFPVPIPTQSTNGFPTVTIDYKKYGAYRAEAPLFISPSRRKRLWQHNLRHSGWKKHPNCWDGAYWLLTIMLPTGAS